MHLKLDVKSREKLYIDWLKLCFEMFNFLLSPSCQLADSLRLADKRETSHSQNITNLWRRIQLILSLSLIMENMTDVKVVSSNFKVK